MYSENLKESFKVKAHNKESIGIAFAYTGVIVGAGFSTGQELLQFFTNFGLWSIPGVILTAIIVIFVGRQVSKVGYRLDTESYEVSLVNIFGNKLGTIIDYILIFFLYGLSVIMIAGAGSAFQDGFGIEPWLGSLIMTIAVFITLLLNFDNIMKALGSITPFLIVLVLIIAGYHIINPMIPFSEVNEYRQIDRTPTGLWWWDAITYAGLDMATVFSFLTIVGSGASSHKVARRGPLIGGIIIIVLMLLINVGMLVNLKESNEYGLPTLLLAEQIHPILGFCMAIIMMLVIYNTIVGLMYPFLTRFTKAYSKKYLMLLIVGLLFGYGLSFVGFVDLVNFFYPIFGYIGIVISIALFIRWIMNKFTKKKLV